MLQWCVNEHQTYLERKLGSLFDSLEMVDSDTPHATVDYYHSPDSVYYHKRGSSEFDEEDAVRDTLDLVRSLRSTKSDMTTAQVARDVYALSLNLGDLGMTTFACTVIGWCVKIRRHLCADSAIVFGPELATALNALGSRVAMLCRYGEALSVTEEAVKLRRP